MIATKEYGFTPDMIDWSSPSDMEPYLKAHKEELKEKDYLAWLFNQYTLSAVSVAIEHNLVGKKAKLEYIKEPFLSKAFENDELTERQIYEKELRDALLAEQMWIKAGKINGLSETII